jgi:hypothetical protein
VCLFVCLCAFFPPFFFVNIYIVLYWSSGLLIRKLCELYAFLIFVPLYLWLVDGKTHRSCGSRRFKVEMSQVCDELAARLECVV